MKQTFKIFLVEDLQGILDKILKSVKSVIDKRTDTQEVTDERSGNYLTVHLRNKFNGGRQTCTFQTISTKDGWDLHLSDIYLPEELRGQGVFTEILTKIRKIEEMSGKCVVHVGMNVQGWKKIISRAGFTQI